MPVVRSTCCVLAILWAMIAGGVCLANSYPRVQTYPSVNASLVIADNSTQYTVSTTISDDDGYEDIVDIRVLFNFTEAGGDQSRGRGYLAWGATDALITRYGGNWVLADAAGGGRWGYTTDIWGGTTYITPVSCSMVTGGSASGGTGTRKATWTFRAKPAWAMNPLINDADVWIADSAGNIRNWRDGGAEFDVVAASCTSYCATPRAPVISGRTSGSYDVAISPEDSDTDLFCIRITPAVLSKDFVQADGTLGGQPVFRSKAGWGTTTVVGLPSSTQFRFKVRAARTDPGYCPSPWGSSAVGTTAVLERPIDYAQTGWPIHKGLAGMDALPKGGSAKLLADNLDVCFNSSMRYGGDGYNWKVRTAPGGANTQTTLQRLREARDRNSYLQILTNTRGIGQMIGGSWVYTDTSPETLAALAADWLYYCNKLVPNVRQGDPRTPRDQAVLSSINWWYDEKQLARGEPAPPKVTYWEIGNEPEGPYPAPPLTPEEYAIKYKAITQALIAEDPTIQVGPSVMTADNGNAWLDAVFSDPTNRVDFVCYHPYGNLYFIVKNSSGGLLDADDLNVGLNALRQSQFDKRRKIGERLAANGRPSNTPTIASEWNPSSWQGSYYYTVNRTMAHALGIADTLFTFAELGFVAAQYWDYTNWPSTSAIEAPGHKLFKTLQAFLGDRLLGSFAEADFRLYTTYDSRTGRLIIWALNFSEYRDKPVRFAMSGDCSGLSVIQRRLAALSGTTSLITKNDTDDPFEKVNWIVTDLTGTLNPSDFTVTFPRATLTMLVFDRPLKSLPDGARVTLEGKAVTACYPSEGYLYIEQDDRSYGLRVIGDCWGVAVGNRVTIAGTMGTVKPDGSTPSERCVNADQISCVSSSGSISPVGMTCRAVGGGPRDGTVGVNDPWGLGNVGLLVRVVGKVTLILDSERMYVDDGSNIPDTDGRIGVLVKCPSTASLGVGDTVVVTGVVEGNVPQGWSVNRRCIRARTTADVTRIVP